MINDDQPILRWLHLTDLHVGGKAESQMTAISSLLEAVTQFSEGKKFDLVMLTGDLAFSGLREQYDELHTVLIQPLRSMPLCTSARFIATPGNHDLDCTIEYPPIWKDLGRSRQDKFFNLGSDGTATRGTRAQAFLQYREFMRRSRIDGVDPTVSPASVILIEGKTRPVCIISVVTAFFSDKEVSDRQRAPAPIHPIRTLAQELPSDSLIIVMGHHPPDWFTSESEHHLHTFLVERNALYLHGHEHRIRSKFGARGLASLGFGAAYQASGDSPPVPYYRNSFAICELTDSLHVLVVSWDSEHGQWRAERSLPGDFIDRSDRLKDGYLLTVPTTRLSDRSRPYVSIGAAIRAEVQIDRCIWLAGDHPKRWTQLLTSLGLVRNVDESYILPTQRLPAGHIEFRVKDRQGQYLVHAASGQGDVISYEQLQAINTELDRQAYDGCIVATLGELSSDARTLANQLASRKAITILERGDIVKRSLRVLPASLERAIFGASSTEALAGSLIFTANGYALLIQERTNNTWFRILTEDGSVAPESSGLVQEVRREQVSLRNMRYDRSSAVPAAVSRVMPFDRARYLEASYKHFNDVKYAPLAAVGLRFRKASLSEIYVEASADVGGTSKAVNNLTRAVSEIVESLQLLPAQQQQLEAQMRSRYGLNRPAEVGAARRLYQRYNNIIVLGDPGSGKTCFVQYEILAYSEVSQVSSWYSHHLPIYVSLAEAARLLDDKTALLDVCSIVSSRRGIDLPRDAIERSLSDGHAAFFFDGLDEVGYVDKRISLLSEIDNLFRRYAARGNRFVIASRPAAIQPVDIPDGLTYLQLKGLTEGEIRTLANRVVTARLGDAEQDSITRDEEELVERLLEDVRSEPGIARIARNPLLLTLLVLIYANSGALSARRHLVYTQAIKTLVSVRGRQTRAQRISEADLRARLGALALAIFKRQIAEIPRRSEVVAVFAPMMHRVEKISHADAADAFIQEIAEATGLLAIHTKVDEHSEELITFMHYSFLEYYAAAGLLAGSYSEVVPNLSGNPRWRDVITLLFGMLSEQGNVTPVIEGILKSNAPDERVTRYRTVLALDCAAECDVAPELTQEHLAATLYETVAEGAAKYSAELRAEIAERLDSMLIGPGSKVEQAIMQGLGDKGHLSAAAFADLIARIGEKTALSPGIVSAFEESLAREDPVTRTATMYAIERRPELRTEKARLALADSLRGSLPEKYAALKAISAVPAFAELLREPLQELLEDPNGWISAGAAQCLLSGALRESQAEGRSRSLDKIILKLQPGVGDKRSISVGSVTLDKDELRKLVLSLDPKESELAIRYVPMVRGESQFSYELLMGKLRTAELPSQRAACLESIRASAGAVDLITIADTDAICAQLRDKHRNVRIAAIMLLGEMPDDEQVVNALQDHLKASSREPAQEGELAETARALSKHVRRNRKLRVNTLRALLARLPPNATAGFGDEMEQQHTVGLMSVCESIGGITDEAAAWRLYSLGEDYRAPLIIRRHAVRLFGCIVEPTPRAAEALLNIVKQNDVRLNEARYEAVASFVSQCRRRVEYVRRIYDHLSSLRDGLCHAWDREVARKPDSIGPPILRSIRESVVTVAHLMVSYEEFAGRATGASEDTGDLGLASIMQE